MNKKGNVSNLKPLKKGDPRTVEVSRMGGKASQDRFRRRQTMKEDLNLLLKLSLRKGDLATAESVLSLAEAKELNISVQTAIDIAMVERAIMGDVQAAQYIRDTIGEKPTDKIEVDQSLTVESWAKSHKVKL